MAIRMCLYDVWNGQLASVQVISVQLTPCLNKHIIVWRETMQTMRTYYRDAYLYIYVEQ